MKALNKRTNTPADFSLPVGLSEADIGGFLKKNLFLKISQYPQKTLVLDFFLKKVAGRPEGLQLYYKETPAQVFSCEYCKIFKTNFQKHLWRASGIRVWVTGLVFLFLNRHLSSWTEPRLAFKNLRRNPLMSQLKFYIGYFWSF